MVRKFVLAFACLAVLIPLNVNGGTKEFTEVVEADLVSQTIVLCVDGPSHTKEPVVAFAPGIESVAAIVNNEQFKNACGKVMWVGDAVRFLTPKVLYGDPPYELNAELQPILNAWHSMDMCKLAAQELTLKAFATIKEKLDPKNRIIPIVFCYSEKRNVINKQTRDLMTESRIESGGKNYDI